jgi:hypothetical protein
MSRKVMCSFIGMPIILPIDIEVFIENENANPV